MSLAADELRINCLPGWRERETAKLFGEVEFLVNTSSPPGRRFHHLLSGQADLLEKHLSRLRGFGQPTQKPSSKQH